MFLGFIEKLREQPEKESSLGLAFLEQSESSQKAVKDRRQLQLGEKQVVHSLEIREVQFSLFQN